MMRRGPREPHDEPDTTYVYSRTEDRSLWAKTSALLEKYKALAWLVGAIAISAGYGFKTPAQAQSETDKKIEALATRISKQEQLLLGTQTSLETLVRLRCLEAKTTKGYSQLIDASGLSCPTNH